MSSAWPPLPPAGHAVDARLVMSFPGSGLNLKIVDKGLAAPAAAAASSLSSFSASFSMMGTLSFLHMVVGIDPDRLLPDRLPNLLPG